MTQSLKKDWPDFDELDMRLIRELEEDGRASYQSLASKLDTSQPTVRRRVARLIDQGAIRIIAVPAYSALGYKTQVNLLIKVPHGNMEAVAKKLTLIDSIKFIWLTAGSYDILAVAHYHNFEEYLRLFAQEMNDVPRDLELEVVLSLRVSTLGWIDWDIFDGIIGFAEMSASKPTELDLAVIRGLIKSPRASGEELAKEIGASSPSVRSSLRRIISQGIVRVFSFAYPENIENTIFAPTLIQVHPSDVNTLIDQLKPYPSVKLIATTIGRFNCLIWTSFSDRNQMYHFLAKDLAKISGVMHYETLIPLKLQKESFSSLDLNPAK